MRYDDYVYWNAMISSDGNTNPLDKWPYYREYMAYKDWFERVEDKALHTLKLAVAQLLADFGEDGDTTKNPVFEGTNLTKRGQMEHLMSLIEGNTDESKNTASQQPKAKGVKKTRKMTSTKRDLNYIDQLLDDAICEDIHL